MRSLVVAVACLAMAAGLAPANPVSRDELAAAVPSLTEQLEEPAGFLVTTHLPKLGLLKGDVVFAVNGIRMIYASELGSISHAASAVHLDVMRAGKPISVRLALAPSALEVTEDRKRLGKQIAARSASGIGLKAVTKNGATVGVMLANDWFGLTGPIRGDILRKVDGKPVTSVDQAFKALEAALPKPKVALELERNGRAYTLTLQLGNDPSDDPELVALLAAVEEVSDTSYKVPKKLLEKASANPLMLAKGARIVPAIKNGTFEGTKLYAIRPNTIYAKLGFENGDTVLTINGVATASGMKPAALFGKLGAAKRVTIELVRRGKPVRLDWTIK